MGNEFKGTTINEKNIKRFHELETIAKRLKTYETPIFRIDLHIGETDSSHRSGVIGIETTAPMVLMTEEQRGTVAEMMFIADDVVITPVEKTKNVRVSFGIRDIWS